MSKITIEFDMSDENDKQDYALVLNSGKLHSIINSAASEFRKLSKYAQNNHELREEYYTLFLSICSKYNIDPFGEPEL